MEEKKEEENMITKNSDTQKTTTISNSDVMKLAKKGANKYRKTLDKLAKN